MGSYAAASALALVLAMCSLDAAAVALQRNADGTVAVAGERIPVTEVARAVGQATGLQVDGLEHLGDTAVTLNFTAIDPPSLMQILAHEAGVLVFRAGNHLRFASPDVAGRLRLLLDAVDNAGDDAALAAALPPLLDAIRPVEGEPAFTGYDYLQQAAELAEAGQDLPRAEALVRARLLHMAHVFGSTDEAAYGLALGELARLRMRQGDAGEARRAYERGLAIATAALGEGHAELAPLQAGLAHACQDVRPEEAERLFRLAVAGYAALGDEYGYELGWTLDSLVVLLMGQQRWGEVVPLAEHNLAVQRRLSQDPDRHVLATWQLAQARLFTGELPAAAELLEQLVAINDGGRYFGGEGDQNALAAIRALGPYADFDAATGADALSALRDVVAAGLPDAVRGLVDMLLVRRAVHALAGQPGAAEAARTCVAIAELRLGQRSVALREPLLARMAEGCLESARRALADGKGGPSP